MQYRLIGLVLLLLSAAPTMAQETYGIRHDRDMTAYETYIQHQGAPDHRPVVALVYTIDGEPVSASGTLIAQQWVLTAAHNLMDDDNRPLSLARAMMHIAFGTDFQRPEKTMPVVDYVLHPGWMPNEYFGDGFGIDIALVKLQQPVTDWPLARLDRKGEANIGNRIVVMGFGDFSPVADGYGMYSAKSAFENILDRNVTAILPDEPYPGDNRYIGGLIGFDFDRPGGGLNMLSAHAPVDEVNADFMDMLGGGNSAPGPLPMEGTSVPGMSGGPAFVRINGNWLQAGISAAGTTDSAYGDVALYTRVASHIRWIDSVID